MRRTHNHMIIIIIINIIYEITHKRGKRKQRERKSKSIVNSKGGKKYEYCNDILINIHE